MHLIRIVLVSQPVRNIILSIKLLQTFKTDVLLNVPIILSSTQLISVSSPLNVPPISMEIP